MRQESRGWSRHIGPTVTIGSLAWHHSLSLGFALLHWRPYNSSGEQFNYVKRLFAKASLLINLGEQLTYAFFQKREWANDLFTSPVSPQPQKALTNMLVDRKRVRMSLTSFVNFYLMPLLDSIKQIDKIISPSFLAAQPSLSVDAL